MKIARPRRLAAALIVLGAITPSWTTGTQLDTDLVRDVQPAVVQIAVRIVETEDGRPEETIVPCGSGTVVSPNGVVLTANHVVDISDLQQLSAAREAGFKRSNRSRTVRVIENQYVLLFSERDEQPRPRFTAELAKTAPEHDLAALRITGGSAGQPLDIDELGLPFVQLGDSDQVMRGDRIWVIGYPGITDRALIDSGEVNTFETAPGIVGRALIVTDATVSGGSSGGPAVNAEGQIIGIAISVSVPECRAGDTNRDGVTDELDVGCIPVGSTVAKLRPVNFAKPLLEQVLATPVPATSSTVATAPDSTATSTSTVAPSATPTSDPTATASPTPGVTTEATPKPTAVSGFVAYRDGFDDPDASLLSTGSTDPSTSQYSFNGGEYVIETLDPEFDGAPTRFLGRYRDVVVALDARLVGETENRTVFVYCRQGSEAEGFTAYGFSVEPGDSYFRLLRYEDGEVTPLGEAVRQDAIEPGGTVNRLELRCIGTEIIARVNGIEVARVEDDTVREGRVGFGTAVLSNALPGTVDARFNNLEVTNVP